MKVFEIFNFIFKYLPSLSSLPWTWNKNETVRGNRKNMINWMSTQNSCLHKCYLCDFNCIHTYTVNNNEKCQVISVANIAASACSSWIWKYEKMGHSLLLSLWVFNKIHQIAIIAIIGASCDAQRTPCA